MMKPISSVIMKNRLPYEFVWNRKSVQIARVLEHWRDVGEWWRNEPELWFWRVEGTDWGVYELAWDPVGNRWWMFHIYD